ncbi:MAG: toxin-antitoxin system HicB family antitoxin [Lachnospiraceae bacterium]|nr:toxin-antitoxin system HicB family antitoxin [Lachnospiraceae bacterium]
MNYKPQGHRISCPCLLFSLISLGKRPEREYSGQFITRISPELHYRIAFEAERQSMSLNSYVREALEQYCTDK